MATSRTPKGAKEPSLRSAAAPNTSPLIVAHYPGTHSSFVMMLLNEWDPPRIQQAILAGRVSGSGLRAIRSALKLTVEDMAHVLAVAARTINRKEKAGAPLSVSEGDRAFRLARIADLAVDLIGNREKALAWLQTPNSYLGDKTPLQMLDTEVGCDFVTESLYSIAYGGVA